MARTEIERVIQPSLLDRLTDLEPQVPSDPSLSRELSVREFRAAVQRDVETLLNTRRTIETAPEGCPELRASGYEYGLPDTTGVAVASAAVRERLLHSLQDALERFEPRLASPSVQIVDMGQAQAPQVRFIVRAILRLEPTPERVVFDTMLEVASGAYEVREAAAQTDVPS